MRRNLFAGCVGVLLAGTAGAAPLTMMPVRLLDTSGEGGDHAAREAALTGALAAAWAEGDRPKGGGIGPSLTTAAVAQACPDSTPACLMGLARRKGDGPAAFLVVQKASTLILTLYASVVDPATGRLIAHRELSFRGDTVTSWQKAGSFAGRSLAAAAAASATGQSAARPAPTANSLPAPPANPPATAPRH